jgi:tRNA dimethylallyltransferase
MTQNQRKNKSKKLPPLIVILGPTASGKSKFAIKLAKKFNGEIVSADSRQIYRGMDIATGKLLLSQKLKIKSQKYKSKIKNKKIRKLYYGHIDSIPHYMIDIINPDQEFTVAEYKEKALKVIYDIIKRKKIPFLVGGTGLYISAIVENLEIPKVPPDLKLRKKLEKEIERKLKAQIAKHFKMSLRRGEADEAILKINGIASLSRQGGIAHNDKTRKLIKKIKEKILRPYYKKLLKLDPEAAQFVQKDNPRRIIRALEVCLTTDKPFSQLRKKGKPLFNVLQIGIKVPRKKLYQRIDQRVDKMMRQGLVEEAKRLARKYPFSLPSMSGIGYKEIGECLAPKHKNTKTQKQCLSKAIQKIKYRTHQYARRQETWFSAHGGKDKRIKWVKNYIEAEKLIKKFLN